MELRSVRENDKTFVLYYEDYPEGGTSFGKHHPIVEGSPFGFQGKVYEVKTIEITELPGSVLAWRVTV